MKRRSVPGDPTERGRRSRSEAVKTATAPRDSTASTVSISVIIPWGRSERTTMPRVVDREITDEFGCEFVLSRRPGAGRQLAG